MFHHTIYTGFIPLFSIIVDHEFTMAMILVGDVFRRHAGTSVTESKKKIIIVHYSKQIP